MPDYGSLVCEFTATPVQGVWRCDYCQRSTPEGRVYQSPPVRGCKARQLPCAALGAEIGKEDCPSCQGTVRIKTFACAIHGRCTLAKKLPDISCCQGCKEYQHPRDSADDGRGG